MDEKGQTATPEGAGQATEDARREKAIRKAATRETVMRRANEAFQDVQNFIYLVHAYEDVNKAAFGYEKTFEKSKMAREWNSILYRSDCLGESFKPQFAHGSHFYYRHQHQLDERLHMVNEFAKECREYIKDLEGFTSLHDGIYPGIKEKHASVSGAMDAGGTREAQAALERSRRLLENVLIEGPRKSLGGLCECLDSAEKARFKIDARLNRALALEGIVANAVEKLMQEKAKRAAIDLRQAPRAKKTAIAVREPREAPQAADRHTLWEGRRSMRARLAAAVIIIPFLIITAFSIFKDSRAPRNEQGARRLPIGQPSAQAQSQASALTFIAKNAAQEQKAEAEQEHVFTAGRGEGVWDIAKRMLAQYSPENQGNQAVASLTNRIVANPEKFGLDKSEILPVQGGGFWLVEGATISIANDDLKAYAAERAPAGREQKPAQGAGENSLPQESSQGAAIQADTLLQAAPDSMPCKQGSEISKPDSVIDKPDSVTNIIFEQSQNTTPAELPIQEIEIKAGHGIWVLAERMAEARVDGYKEMKWRKKQSVVKSIMNELVSRKEEFGIENCLRHSDNYKGGWMLKKRAVVEIAPMEKFLAGPGKLQKRSNIAPGKIAA